MKSSVTILLISFLCTIDVFSQSEKIFDSTIGETSIEHTGIIPENTISFGGPLLTQGIFETIFANHSSLHPNSIAFDGTFYYVVGGGTSPGDVAQLDTNFNLVAIQNVTLDCRSVFYNPADGHVYIKSWSDNGLYRLNTNPFNGGYDGVFANLFQDAQSNACLSADGSLMYDHLDGVVNVYDFITGLTVNTITLNLQHNLNWPRGFLIAHTGTYLLTFADNVVYAYDPSNGNSISNCTLLAMPASYEWSISYTNGMFFLTEETETTWYVWTIDDGAVSVKENDVTPLEFSLEQNYPNPFNPSTRIKFQIPELSFVTLKVYDVLGSEIVTLVNNEKPIGTHIIEFNATNLPSGIYIYQLQTPNFTQTKKMILLK
jgi:outer membrane protein assembly factor BamB